jgi:2-C-methyl-D-erythritol 4-phosphate cytidylyltransferase
MADGSTAIIDRSKLRIVQTPQIFSAETLRKAYEQPFDERFTDDASVVEAMGVTITSVEGEARNIKITTPNDLAYAEWLVKNE